MCRNHTAQASNDIRMIGMQCSRLECGQYSWHVDKEGEVQRRWRPACGRFGLAVAWVGLSGLYVALCSIRLVTCFSAVFSLFLCSMCMWLKSLFGSDNYT